MAVVMPEEAAAMFARNPELVDRAPEAFQKVRAALSAKQAAHQAVEKAGLTSKATPKDPSGKPAPPSRPTLSGLNDTRRQLDQLAPGRIPGRGSVISRLVIAALAGVFVLELISQMTGQYFNWNLKNAPTNLASTAKYVGLYGGQAASLKAKQQQAAV